MDWPRELPLLPIYNNTDLCDDCTYLYDGLFSDWDHCREMKRTDEDIKKLTPEQLELLHSINKTIECPLYKKKE